VSDNHGGDRDEHLPLGAGNIDWPWALGVLKRMGYDGTITAEVFSRDKSYLVAAKDQLREWWDAA
jgi:sugar phosphate isomerase/epimerase